MDDEQQAINKDVELFLMERRWRQTLKHYDKIELLYIFPEAKPVFGKAIKKDIQTRIIELAQRLTDVKKNIREALLANFDHINDDLIKSIGRNQLAVIQKEYVRLNAQLEMLHNLHRTPVDSIQSKVTDAMIARAREYPIEKLIEINRAWFATCLWHDDHHASMYCKKNYAHCFSCGKNADVIAIYMEKHHVNFREAVLKLQH